MTVVQGQVLTFVRCGHVGSILLAWNMSWSTYVFAKKFIYDKKKRRKKRTSICRGRWFAYLFFKYKHAHEIKLRSFSIMLPSLLWKMCSPLWPISWFMCVCVIYVILPNCNWEVSTEPKILCPVLWEKFVHRYRVLRQLPLVRCFVFTDEHQLKFV